MIENTDI